MSISIKIHNQKAEVVEEVKLDEKVFKVDISEALVHQAFVAQISNERQVLADTKTRSEVRGGGRKPWRQKGTGRARAGSSRSPIWIGGGVTFGPTKMRNFKKNINRKMKQKALLMVMSDRIKNEHVAVVDELKLDKFKTKKFNEIIAKLEKKAIVNHEADRKRSVLVVIDTKDEKIKYSGRNLEGVKVINLDNINIFDLLKYRDLVLTKKGVKEIEKKYSK